MLVFCKLNIALLHVWFMFVIILYLTYVGSKWIGGDLLSLKTSWICVSRREDLSSVFIFSLKLCILLISSEFM